MNISKVYRKVIRKAISITLMLALLLTQFAGLGTAFATVGTETQVTTDVYFQTSPAIYGGKIVWEDNRNGNWDIYMYDLTTETETRISTDSNIQRDSAIYGDKIVWEDNRNGNWDIYMYELSTKTETRITTNSSNDANPKIYGDKIVWQRGGSGWNIDMYDLKTKEITHITNDSFYHEYPEIYGDKVVWQDNRNGNYDIYIYNITTGSETRITTNTSDQRRPSVHKDKIVWHDYRNGSSNPDIYMYNLTTGVETRITADPNYQLYPKIFGDKVVWHDDRNHSLSEPNFDIYTYDLKTGIETRITTDQSNQGFPAIGGDKIVWDDLRNGNYDIYYTTLVNTDIPAVNDSDPVSGTINVLADKKITVNFNKSIQQSINFNQITLKAGNTVVGCTYSISGNVLIIDPMVNLVPNTLHTVTIPAGAVKDLAGNDTITDYTFSFTTENLLRLPYLVTDAILDPDNPVMYITSKSERKLYAVNFITGATSVMDFVYMPESLDIGKGIYSNELYVTLLHQEHSSYWLDENQSGSIAVIDRQSFTLIDTIETILDPFDIVAGRDGYLYVPSGSGQWTSITSYNRTSKQLGYQSGIRQMSYAKLHPTLERIYTVNTDTTPRYYTAYNVYNGNFTDPSGGYDSPYHGDYSLSTNFALDPTGQYIFNGSGIIFSTAENKVQDMVYSKNMGSGFTDIAFEPDLSSFYTISTNGELVNIYNGTNISNIDSITLGGPGKYLFRRSGQLIALIEPTVLSSNFRSGIQVIDLPMVTKSNPTSGAMFEPVDKTITLTFDTSILAGTTFAKLTLTDSTNNTIPVTTSIFGKTLTIDPVSNLTANTTYTVTLPAGSVKDLLNNPLKLDYTFNFSTQTTNTGVVSGGSNGDSSGGDNGVITSNELTLSTSTTTTTAQVEGQSVATVTVNELQTLTTLNQNPNVSTVIIPVSETSDVANVRIPLGLLVALANKSSTVLVQTTTGSYSLPAAEIKTAELVKELKAANTSDIIINIVIAEAKSAQVAAVRKFVEQHGLTQLVTPLEFKVEGQAGDKKVEINNFDGYVSRTINLLKPANPATMVGVVQNADGTLSPVPTQFKTENGKSFAIIKRKTNSVYTVIENKKAFADVNGHWAKEDINTLGSKLILSGISETTFAPENKVTRAQFATIIVRALGLEAQAAKTPFSDVKAGDWYAGAVGAAVDAGIVKGYSDGRFKPNAFVTREEAAAMTAQALKVAGVDISLTSAETKQYLDQLKDGVKINTWAKSFVAVGVKNGIIRGNNNGTFAPENNSTRAETAVMIKKMLSKANFI
ncbi:MAG: S-layer homology domain-containing protein [Carboxydocellales bacterium]